MRLLLLMLSMAITTISSAQYSLDCHTLEFTSDLENFDHLEEFKRSLDGVDIVALGENSQGLGEVFEAKTELVQFLHEEMGFDLVLFETGYGDAALAWSKIDSLSPEEFTQSFTSESHYRCEEIESLAEYAMQQESDLKIMGFDCQPQQDLLIEEMAAYAAITDPLFANRTIREMRKFNRLYQLEYTNDTAGFYQTRNEFLNFLNEYVSKTWVDLDRASANTVAIYESIKIFRKTYGKLRFGQLMSYPDAVNLRMKSMVHTIKKIKEENPESKIIIWAQNSHIENSPKPGYKVRWMGHALKREYGDRYYSLGSVVYSGKNLDLYRNRELDFEHDDASYLAYHLNQTTSDNYVMDLRKEAGLDFLGKPLLGMENEGDKAQFVAHERFDGILFIRRSDIPTLLKN